MKARCVAAVALIAALVVPTVGWAHEGHAHKVMGTISAIDGNHVTLKSTDGKTVMVMLDAKTKITRGKTKVDATALKIGDRVVAEGTEEKEMIMAASLQLGAAPSTPAAKPAATHPH